MAFRLCAIFCLLSLGLANSQQADSPDVAKAASPTFLASLHNDYEPGVNGPVFETPAPGDDRSQSYVDTGKGAVILGFFFMGLVILICWMECKTFCKTVTVFGH